MGGPQRRGFSPVELSRRQLLGAGVAAGMIATTARSSTLADIVQGAPAPAPVAAATVPARPRIVVDPAINPQLLQRARASFDRHRNILTHPEIVAIADFSQASREHRFFLLDTNTGQVTKHLVAHGRG